MSLHRQVLQNEYEWLQSELRAATTSDARSADLGGLSSQDLDRVGADSAFLLALRLLKAFLVNKVAGAFQTYVEEQRIRRDFRIARMGHKELARGLMTLKLRRFNHIGRVLKLESDLSPKLQEDGE